MAPAISAEDLLSATGIQRPVLAAILAAATCAAGTRIRLGVSFESLVQDANGVDVLFGDDSQARYDLVIGADSIHSVLRRLVLPGFAGPVFTGSVWWRAIVPHLRGNSTMYLSETVKAGLNPISAN